MACKAISGSPIDYAESIGREDEESPAPTTVLSVKVDPPSGSGSFTLEVTYQVGTSLLVRSSEGISCSYVAPDGATILIDTIYPQTLSVTDQKSTTMSSTLPFTATQEGEYTATCQNDSASSKASTGFTVKNAITANGQRTWDGLYTDVDPKVFLVSHCSSPVSVKLELRADGTAWMQTLGEGRYGAKCENNYRIKDDTQHMEWTLTGLHDPQTETATFTECNNTSGATGQVSYKDGVLSGTVTCKASTDPKYPDLKITITIP